MLIINVTMSLAIVYMICVHESKINLRKRIGLNQFKVQKQEENSLGSQWVMPARRASMSPARLGKQARKSREARLH